VTENYQNFKFYLVVTCLISSFQNFNLIILLKHNYWQYSEKPAYTSVWNSQLEALAPMPFCEYSYDLLWYSANLLILYHCSKKNWAYGRNVVR
jgi:hypothetical protein